MSIPNSKLQKSTISLNVLDTNCIKAKAELKNDIGVFEYETYLFTKTPDAGGLGLISFVPRLLKFGCKIGHNVDGKNTPNLRPKPQGIEFKSPTNLNCHPHGAHGGH